jgi:hypothetical protein
VSSKASDPEAELLIDTQYEYVGLKKVVVSETAWVLLSFITAE